MVTVKGTIWVDGVEIEFEPRPDVSREIVRGGTKLAARKLANELDRVARERALLDDEILLRSIVRDEHGV